MDLKTLEQCMARKVLDVFRSESKTIHYVDGPFLAVQQAIQKKSVHAFATERTPEQQLKDYVDLFLPDVIKTMRDHGGFHENQTWNIVAEECTSVATHT